MKAIDNEGIGGVESRNIAGLKQSKESLARMQKDMEEIQNLDAVKEYKFIT